MYQPQRPARAETVCVRTLRYGVRLWGDARAGGPPLALLHGWMDVGASWQFVADAFSAAFVQGRLIIAPDWRGFGRSMPSTPCDSYHFVDYLADLDHLLDHYAPGRCVDLAGHSMGGNAAMMYAGARPARVRRLVNLEGFGLAATQPAQAPGRYAQWMDEIRQWRDGEMALAQYDSPAAVARRLMKTNPRLDEDKAAWLARHWAREGRGGRWHILGDAAHKITSAQLYRADEAQALYAAITAPVLAIQASHGSLSRPREDGYTQAEFLARLARVPDCRTATVQDAGHMLHHDQPRAVAALIEEFCAA